MPQVVMPKYLPKFEALLAAHEGPFLLGSQLAYCDMLLLQVRPALCFAVAAVALSHPTLGGRVQPRVLPRVSGRVPAAGSLAGGRRGSADRRRVPSVPASAPAGRRCVPRIWT